MTSISSRFGLPVAVVALLGASMLGFSRPAAAALGDNDASIAKDRIAMRATDAVTPMPSFDVHRLIDPRGGAVSEYVDRTGTVFAVTWKGQQSPDLKALLGTYYGRYLTAASLHRTGHHLVTIHAPDLVLTVVHFQRISMGHAYLPSQLPGGFTPANLR